MVGSPIPRIVLVGVLLVGLLGLCVWYGSLAPAPAMGDFPGAEELAASPDRYVGDRVSLWGTVRSTDPVVIETKTGDAGEIELKILQVPMDLDPGDSLNVFGVAESDRTIRAISIVSVPPWGRLYTWGISFLAGLWVLGRILTGWTIDGWALTRRRRSLWSLSGGDGDA